MTYKTLLVHLDTSTRANVRLTLALKLARTYGARLNGLFAAFEPHPHPFHLMSSSADYYDEHRKLRAEQLAAIERLFRAELARTQIEGAWVPAEPHPIAVMELARSADLTIVGQTDLEDPEAYVADHFIELVVMGAGGPVLVMPYTGDFASIGERVLIGWNGSREAARAVHDAIPFIARAAHVTIAAAATTFGPAASQASCADLSAMLACHGATTVDIERFDRHASETSGDALLRYAADGGFDLLVMGAYGHVRLQEMVLGGATRSVLATMTLPVLMSH